jgi:acylphosphatase
MTGRVYRVRGRVQGVGFRWWTRRQAATLGIVGSVRNERDGSVRVDAWGVEAVLAEFERLLGEGPPGAQVEAVDVLPPPSGARPDGFSIER